MVFQSNADGDLEHTLEFSPLTGLPLSLLLSGSLHLPLSLLSLLLPRLRLLLSLRLLCLGLRPPPALLERDGHGETVRTPSSAVTGTEAFHRVRGDLSV